MDFDTDKYLPEVEDLMRRLISSRPREPAGTVGIEHLDTGGKRLRARLALSALDRLGCEVKNAIGWAAACELLHNATLIHDDLQDGDRVRRGRPTAWVKHGMAQAINAGDLMWVSPYLAVGHIDTTDATRWRLSQVLASRSAMIVRGQATEWAMSEAGDARRDAYLRSITGKTSALFELPVHGAAILAGYDFRTAETISEPFSLVGMLFQMQDDVLDLFGEKGRSEIGSDLAEGKISALVVEHLALHPGEREDLLALLRCPRDETCPESILSTIERFRDGGALERVCKRMQTISRAAVDADALKEQPALRDLTVELVEVILRPIAHVLSDSPSQS